MYGEADTRPGTGMIPSLGMGMEKALELLAKRPAKKRPDSIWWRNDPRYPEHEKYYSDLYVFLNDQRDNLLPVMAFLQENTERWAALPDKNVRKIMLQVGICDAVQNILKKLPNRGHDTITEEFDWSKDILVWELGKIYWRAKDMVSFGIEKRGSVTRK